MVTLQGLPPIWETFITTISNNNILTTFDELVGRCTQEETMMIARGMIQKHEEGDPSTFAAQDKKRKLRGRPYGSRKPALESKDSKRRLRDIECFNCHKHGHYAQHFPRKRDAPRSNRGFYDNRFNDRKKCDDRRRGDERRRDDRRRKICP